MPILANISTGGGGNPDPVPDPDARRLEFRALDGDTISWTSDEWIISSGIQGLNVPPREIITERVPGMDGARLREIRTTERTVIVPFFVRSVGSDPRPHLDQLARLRHHFDYRRVNYQVAEGTFDLVAFGPTGERSLRCAYVDGMEGSTGHAHQNRSTWSTFDAKLVAVRPYWSGADWSTPTVGTGAPSPFVSDTAPFPRSIGRSLAIGANMRVAVGGDIESPPNIVLTAPWDTAVITSPQGLSVVVDPVTSGQLVIETGRSRRVTLNGTSRWDLIGDSPRWQPLPPGEALISIELTGATSTTTARVYGTSLWETAW